MDISFIGYSDDLVHVNRRPDLGHQAYEYVDEYSKWDQPLIFLVNGGGKKMSVVGFYTSNACWGFTALMCGPDQEMFPCVITKGHEYSTELILTVPEDTEVTLAN